MSDGDGGKNHRACQPSMRQFVVDSLLSMLFSSESRYANDASVSGRAERSWGNSELNKFRQTGAKPITILYQRHEHLYLLCYSVVSQLFFCFCF